MRTVSMDYSEMKNCRAGFDLGPETYRGPQRAPKAQVMSLWSF